MRFDMSNLEDRHLVLSYAAVILIQGGYFLYILRGWLRLNAEEEKATKPVA